MPTAPAHGDPTCIGRAEFDVVHDQSEAAGLPLVADREEAWRDYRGLRVNYDVPLIALSCLVVVPLAPWSSDRSFRLDVGVGVGPFAGGGG